MIEFTEQLNIQSGWKNDICPFEKEAENFGYKLYPEQRQVLYVMRQIENQKYINSNSKKYIIIKLDSVLRLVLGKR